MIRRSNQTTLLAAALGVCALASALSCASGATRETRRKYPRIRTAEEVQAFTAVAPESRKHRVVAVVRSSSATTSTAAIKADQLAQLRKAAARVGAEAIYEVAVKTRQTRGPIADEHTPFPSLTQGWVDSYYLQGIAVLFKENWPKDMLHYDPKPSGRARPATEGPTEAPGLLPEISP